MLVPELTSFIATEKTTTTVPAWHLTNEDRHFLYLTTLDIGEITVAKFRFRALAIASRPDSNVIFQFEYKHSDKFLPLQRLEWRGRHHINTNIGPHHLRLLSLSGTHIHRLAANLSETGDFYWDKNLPIAETVPHEVDDSFRAALEFVEKEFNIRGIVALGEPPWERSML